jgi:hypothetical protein
MPSLASAFVENFRVGIDIIRYSRPFSWFLWSSSFGAVKDSLPKKASAPPARRWSLLPQPLLKIC